MEARRGSFGRKSRAATINIAAPIFALIAAGLGLAGATAGAHAASTGAGQSASTGSGQAYPTKPIRMLVGFPVGGGADLASRLLAPHVSESLGQQIIVDNRPGSGSAIASEIAARAVPDGHTLVMIGSSHAVNAALYPKLPYAPAADFSAVVLVASSPVVIVVNPALPVKTLKELIAAARARPGQLDYGSGGVNGINHLAAELLKRAAKMDITLVPYKGVAQALPAVIAGEVPILFAALPGTIEQIRQGRVRALAVTSAKRANAAPDIPTVGESGVPGYEATSWYGILAPVHTPARVITRLNAVVLDALKSQAVHDAFIRLGMDPLNTTPREFDAYLRSEIAKWTLVVREAGIRPD